MYTRPIWFRPPYGLDTNPVGGGLAWREVVAVQRRRRRRSRRPSSRRSRNSSTRWQSTTLGSDEYYALGKEVVGEHREADAAHRHRGRGALRLHPLEPAEELPRREDALHRPPARRPFRAVVSRRLTIAACRARHSGPLPASPTSINAVQDPRCFRSVPRQVSARTQPHLSRQPQRGAPARRRAASSAHDYYGTGCPRNHEAEESLTSVYRSEDNGATWVNITHIMNCYWSTLFLHDGALYILGTSQQYGSIFIRRSATTAASPGRTRPTRRTAALRAAATTMTARTIIARRSPVTIHDGRIYKAFEDCTPCVWGTGFQACVDLRRRWTPTCSTPPTGR